MADKRIIIQVFLIIIAGFNRCYSQDFGYDGEKGPTHWGEQYNKCFGKHQSPINIDSLNVQRIVMPPLKLNGFDTPQLKTSILNNGHTVMLSMESKELPTISGGPLKGIYEFSQLHFHWGDNDTFGSEDHIDSKSFPCELHMVFYKKFYGSLEAAMSEDDGLSVLAFFYEVSDYDNAAYDELTYLLANVTVPKTKADFIKPPILRDLLSNDIDHYYTYNGSLTTPPCNEIVTWIDFKQAMPLSHDQIEMFRAIQNIEGEKLTHNFRPLQPIGDRIIYYNILKEEADEDNSFEYKINKDIDLTNKDITIEIPPNEIDGKKKKIDDDGDDDDQKKSKQSKHEKNNGVSIYSSTSGILFIGIILAFNLIIRKEF